MAVACGVRVLRFSVGFGKPVLAWRSAKTGTEYAIGWLPLGGYVRMLDEREATADAPVAAGDRHLAFNTQPLRSRVAIVAAGPIANLLLAIALFTGVNWLGQPGAEAVLAGPLPGSVAERAGFVAQDRVLAISRSGPDADVSEWQSVASFEQVLNHLTLAALDKQDLRVRVERGGKQPELRLALAGLDASLVDAQLMRQIGLVAPFSTAVVGDLAPDGAATKAGLQSGDRVAAVDGQAVVDALGLRERIRSSPGQTQVWRILRSGQALELAITPASVAAADNKSKPSR